MAHNITNEVTLRDIMKMSPESRKSLYQVSGVSGDKPKNIDKVTIDNNTFTDFSAFTFLMEKSYVKSPVRSNSGAIENLDSYATFLTPHLKIDFSLMSIDSYRTMMKLLRSKNEFTVTCYDIVNNIDVTHNMYFATEQMPKLWSIAKALNGDEWVELLGVQDYTIELIGTNTDFSTVSIIYHSNPPESVGGTDVTYGDSSIPKGAQIIVGDIATQIKNNPPTGFKFDRWNTSPNGDLMNYTDGLVTTLNDTDLVLYAIWKPTSNYTLNFSYGLSTPEIDANMQYVYSKPVVYNESIGELPKFEAMPTVTYENVIYSPYHSGAWYKSSVINTSMRVYSGDNYWLNQDSTIYLLYKTNTYVVNYWLDGNRYGYIQAIEYNASVPMVKPAKSGYTFDGWYLDYSYNKKFDGTMPPFDINLYGRWIANE